MLKEFREFALRGNVLELAVAVILGIAFGNVVTSFVDHVLMAAIAGLVGQPNFAVLTFTIGSAVIGYGLFLNAVVNFLLVAFALFLVVKTANRAARARRPDEEAPAERDCPFCLTSIPARARRCSACCANMPEAA